MYFYTKFKKTKANKMGKIFSAILITSTSLLAFEFSDITKSIGISSNLKYVGVKEAYLHNSNNVKSKKMAKLSLGDKLVVIDSNQSKIWQKVEFSNNEDSSKLFGYVPKNILVEDSIQNNLFSFLNKSSKNTNNKISTFTKKDNNKKINIKNKGFSDEEDTERSYKKGFVSSNSKMTNINSKKDFIFNEIAMNIESKPLDEDTVKQFISKGRLK